MSLARTTGRADARRLSIALAVLLSVAARIAYTQDPDPKRLCGEPWLEQQLFN